MILVAAFTMRFRTGENQYCGNHNGSSAQTQGAHILAAAITMRFAACHNHCFANHNGSNAQNRRGPQRRQRAPQPLLQSLETAPATAERAGPPAATTRAAAPSAVSGDCAGHNAHRSPFCSLWRLRRPLRREPGPQRRQRAPQPLLQSLETAPATAERAGPPAATTRPTAPSAVSGHCAGHCGESRAPSGDNARRNQERRDRLLKHPPRSTYNAIRRGPCGESRAPRGDNARRSPFCSLWTLRRPLRREPGPQRRQRAPQPLLQDTAERAGPPAATTRAAGPCAVSGHCAGHCRESRAPSGDNARRSPFCSLWTLRREPGPQRRQRAPKVLLEALDTAPATAERAGPPAATTRAAAPSGGSGYCAGHCGCEV